MNTIHTIIGILLLIVSAAVLATVICCGMHP